MEKSYPSISLCMIAKDEEDWIEQCIRSVLPIVSEIILVDTGSSDRTVEIAEKFGAKVFHRPWDDDFSAPRNLSLTQATGDWILVLDADEAIAPRDLQTLREMTLSPAHCWELTQRHYSNDQRLSNFLPVTGEYPEFERGHGGYFESGLVRLVPNGCGLVYEGRVHELLEHSVNRLKRHTIRRASFPIHHYGHTEKVRKKKNKGKIYTPLGQAKLTEDPSSWKNFFELGVEHNCNGRPHEAVEALRKAVQLNPRYGPSWTNLGYVLCELGRYPEAVQVLQTAVKVEEKPEEAWCNLGVVYMRQRLLPKAEQCFSNALAIKPQYVNVLLNLGKALVLMGRTSEGAYQILRALEFQPTCVQAMLDLAGLYTEAGEHLYAASLIERALGLQPENSLAYFQLGQLFKVTKQAEDALLAFQRFIELHAETDDPRFGEIRTLVDKECAVLNRMIDHRAGVRPGDATSTP